MTDTTAVPVHCYKCRRAIGDVAVWVDAQPFHVDCIQIAYTDHRQAARAAAPAEPVAWVAGNQSGSSGDWVELRYIHGDAVKFKIGDAIFASPPRSAEWVAEATQVSERITAYLSSGGLFNPELADHNAVRDLLIDARAALEAWLKSS
jgi:hypothetical protein